MKETKRWTKVNQKLNESKLKGEQKLNEKKLKGEWK